jgi:glycosyltransferase involved in cell wall biosynthesis
LKILALTKYGPLGASTRVRTLQYLPHLRAAGFHVTVRPLLSNQYLKRRYAGERITIFFLVRTYLERIRDSLRSRQYDLVWVEKELAPWLPGALERVLLGSGVPYVLDYDDAIFHNYDQHPNALVRQLTGRKIDSIMRGAALVVVGNTYLAERAASSGASRVEMIPSVIDLDRYGPPSTPPDGPFTIGWIGSPGSERLLEHVRSALNEVLGRPGTRLALVGASDRALDGVPHETWEWSENTEVELMRRFHVGIMPLADTPWERGKCGFKLIQCMGAARSVVASPIGKNTEIIRNGINGFLATTTEDWVQALVTLEADRSKCVAFGQAGREFVRREYDLAVTAPRLIELFSTVTRHREEAIS